MNMICIKGIKNKGGALKKKKKKITYYILLSHWGLDMKTDTNCLVCKPDA